MLITYRRVADRAAFRMDVRTMTDKAAPALISEPSDYDDLHQKSCIQLKLILGLAVTVGILLVCDSAVRLWVGERRKMSSNDLASGLGHASELLARCLDRSAALANTNDAYRSFASKQTR